MEEHFFLIFMFILISSLMCVYFLRKNFIYLEILNMQKVIGRTFVILMSFFNLYNQKFIQLHELNSYGFFLNNNLFY